MGIREQAQTDLVNILGNPDGPGTPFIIVTPEGGEYPVCGTFGDISLLIDPSSGAAIQGRTINAAYPMALLKAKTERMPEKKWKVKVKDLSGTERILFIVDPPDHDYTIGLTRIKLGGNLSDKKTT